MHLYSCRCKAMENYVQKCAVKDPNIIVDDWRSMHLCGKIFQFSLPFSSISILVAECPDGLVHKDCHTNSCEPTCESVRHSEDGCNNITTGVCFPGCYCPDGLVRSENKCIKPQNCINCKYYLKKTTNKYHAFR